VACAAFSSLRRTCCALAGRAWAKSPDLVHGGTRAQLKAKFFASARPTFHARVCTAPCQWVLDLAKLIPGAGGFPRFVRNRSEQFEARLSLGAAS